MNNLFDIRSQLTQNGQKLAYQHLDGLNWKQYTYLDILNFIDYTVFYFINTKILNKKVLNLVKKDTFLNMTDLIQLAKKKKLNISLYPISEDCWIDVGQWDQYKKSIDKFN